MQDRRGAGFTVPLSTALDIGWTDALAIWAVPAVLAVALWAPQVWPIRPLASDSGFVVRGLWRDPLAWQVTLYMIGVAAPVPAGCMTRLIARVSGGERAHQRAAIELGISRPSSHS